MKPDIKTNADIKLIVDEFYNKVRSDSAIGHIFEDVAKVDWETHLPRMYEFWEMVVFGSGSFVGNPMSSHIRLNTRYQLTEEHFFVWKTLFNQTVNEFFEGENAEQTKNKAQSIAAIMQQRLSAQHLNLPITLSRPTY